MKRNVDPTVVRGVTRRARLTRVYAVATIIALLRLAAGTDLRASETRGFMTPEELDKFATHYYQQPRPELIAAAIASMDLTGFAKDRTAVFTGFFAEVLAANPDRAPEWQKLVAQQEESTRELVKEALRLSRPGKILNSRDHSIEQNDLCWGAFFASGNAAYLRKLAMETNDLDSIWRDHFWAGATAKWSLARNLAEHPLVRPTLESFRAEVDPRTRAHISEVLEKDALIIRDEIATIARTRSFRSSRDSPFGEVSNSRFGTTGNISMRVGADAGNPPDRPRW